MRRAGALSATVLLALVLAVSGCDLVGSLTPFGIGTQDYGGGGGAENFNGDWTGTSANGADLSFQVVSGRVTNIRFRHVTTGCTVPFHLTAREVIIADNAFAYDNYLEGQGMVHFTGRFTSATTCSGNYSFEGLPAGICPTSGSGTFVAEQTN